MTLDAFLQLSVVSRWQLLEAAGDLVDRVNAASDAAATPTLR